mgnify:CR=1 FL=1
MAERKITRASERVALAIDCSKSALRNLMTEQCRTPSGFATFYEDTRAQFVDAGFTERSLPSPKGRRTKFRLAPGGSCYQSEADAWLTPDGDHIELEIHWIHSGPGGCAHPALTEIARMALIGFSYWTHSAEWQSNEVPTEKLLKHETDYHLDAGQRFEYTPAFARELTTFGLSFKGAITRGEIMAIRPKPNVEKEPDTTSLDAERMARSLIAHAKATTGN